MCLVICPINPTQDQIEILFALERIYLTRDGGKSVTFDLLIRNVGSKPIRELRIMYPSSLTNLAAIARCKNDQTARRKISRLRKQQLRRLYLETQQLSIPTVESNWIYGILEHIRIDGSQSRAGTFAVTRQQQCEGDLLLQGYLKQGWSLKTLDELDWIWFLYAFCGIAMFKLKAPPIPQSGDDMEALRPSENMWLRVRLIVKSSDGNKLSPLFTIFSRTNEYWHTFRSAGAVGEWSLGQITKFNPPAVNHLRGHLEAAKRTGLLRLPTKLIGDSVRDWRVFLYREYGVTLERIEHREPPPTKPRATTNFVFPRIADPPGCSRGPLPKFLQWLVGNREDIAYEFWFGSDHHHTAEGGYTTEMTVRSNNRVHIYMPYIALSISLFNLIAGFSGLFRK